VRKTAAAILLAAAAALELVVPKGWSTQVTLLAVFIMTFLGAYLVDSASGPSPTTDGPAVERIGLGNVRQAFGRVRGGLRTPFRRAFEIPHQPWFRGRDNILDPLVVRFRQETQARPRPGTRLPVVLPLHGRPGIGKTATAWELVRRLQRQHAKLLYVNLGNATVPQSSADVLRGFLVDLRRRNIPEDTAWRQVIFRSLTARKGYLVFIDGVHDESQVKELMPGAGCTVIVTSRRDLSSGLGVQSTLVDLPSPDLALDMLSALAGCDNGARKTAPLDAEYAADVVDLCGRLPVAILSVGQRIEQGESVAWLAELLRNDRSRLAEIARGGRSFREGLEAEYEQLSLIERKAFCLLELVESPTFVPWVLAPLLDVSVWEAESLASRLNTSGLLDVGEKDVATGLARYHMHPLVKLFAQDKLRLLERRPDDKPGPTDGEGPEWVERDKAQERLEHGYKSMAARVLRLLEPGFALEGSWDSEAWLPRESRVPGLIALHPEPWARAEFMSLLTCARNAYRDREWALCARVASWLGGCVPGDVRIADLDEVFLQATKAASRARGLGPIDHGSLGPVDVLLAHSWCRIAIEQYEEAFTLLDVATEATATVAGDVVAIMFRRARANLFRGEAFLQVRHRVEASRHLARAERTFAKLGSSAELALAQVLIALMNNAAPDDEVLIEPDAYSRDGGQLQFWSLLQQAEEARKARHWDSAISLLDDAARHCAGDGRREANVSYRSARVHLEHVHSLRDADREADVALRNAAVTSAIRRSADSVRAFRRMGNKVGEIRGRYCLVRAYVAAERFEAAEAQLRQADAQFVPLMSPPVMATEPLAARGAWAHGVVHLGRNDPVAARRALRNAYAIMGRLGDDRSARAVRELYRSIPSIPGQRDPYGDGDLIAATRPDIVSDFIDATDD
jgi:hypothetical protein